MSDDFKTRLQQHAEHIKAKGQHCATEETTKQALILPFFAILGYDPADPLKVRSEYGADMPGVKASERVDYVLCCDKPVMFVEAKGHGANLDNHSGQIARYFNSSPDVKIAALTNGREWRFYTDLKHQNMMDSEPFLTVDLLELTDESAGQLARFCYDSFRADDLRSFAASRRNLCAFRDVIETTLRDVDTEFVRFVAQRAGLQEKLTARFLADNAPLVRQAVADAISGMVVSGLTRTPEPVAAQFIAPAPNGQDEINPDNPRIVTTAAEKRLLEIARDILGGVLSAPEDIVGKDTESYYTILYQGKTNRWLMRYAGDRVHPQIWIPVALTPEDDDMLKSMGMERGTGDSIILEKPEHLMRLSWLLFDILNYCKDDENFKRPAKEVQI